MYHGQQENELFGLGAVMDDELTPEQKFAAEDAETMVPRALMQGRSPEEIAAELARLD
jgi:hypothetical protein